jgi:hypothetical protein
MRFTLDENRSAFVRPYNRQETVIECVGWYDNSSDNPNNPSNPPREVRYGEGTYDEMFYIFLAIHDPKAKTLYLIPAGT